MNEVDTNQPRVCVGTYDKYYKGIMNGKWVTLTDYANYGEFMDACRKLHSDESKPELILLDYDNMPGALYSEQGISEEAYNKIIAYAELDDIFREAYEDYLWMFGKDKTLEDFDEAFVGCYGNWTEFAVELINDQFCQHRGIDLLLNYFDYERYGWELSRKYKESDRGYFFKK